MPLWDTLYRWLCHHRTRYYVDGYIINEKSKGPNIQMLRSKEAKRSQIHNGGESQQNNVGNRRDQLFFYVCIYVDGYIIKESLVTYC